jgi:hypothetical protein
MKENIIRFVTWLTVARVFKAITVNYTKGPQSVVITPKTESGRTHDLNLITRIICTVICMHHDNFGLKLFRPIEATTFVRDKENDKQ